MPLESEMVKKLESVKEQVRKVLINLWGYEPDEERVGADWNPVESLFYFTVPGADSKENKRGLLVVGGCRDDSKDPAAWDLTLKKVDGEEAETICQRSAVSDKNIYNETFFLLEKARSDFEFDSLQPPEYHYVYIVRCSDNTLYTGYTNDPSGRLEKHNAGEGARYTRGRRPLKLVHLERFDNRSDAQSREWKIKQLDRAEKIKLFV